MQGSKAVARSDVWEDRLLVYSFRWGVRVYCAEAADGTYQQAQARGLYEFWLEVRAMEL
ncbi:hypothetical protein ACN28C_10955 [Plantactinospora sp. WMMC1484]|uniref:hypothetical protein n=1 Tax=Plantactinospora sp. WMMC1484 TaxID=3404122 RepID=UPI003BF48D93